MVGAFKARVAPFNVNYRYVDDELVYLLNDDLQPLQKFYLGDLERVKKATADVASQGKAR